MKSPRILMTTLLALALAVPAVAAPSEEIVINGSTTVLPVMQKVSENFSAAHPNIDISLSGGGSGNGIKALTDGMCHIAMSSRDMKPNEITLAKSKNVNPVRTAVAVDALVPVVHPSNPLTTLTAEQLRDIYKGIITNWKDLGGADAPIVVISRDTSSGTYETWEEMIMNKQKVAPSALLQASNGAVVQAVSKNKNAVGYIGFGYLNKSLKKLNVNNIEATPATALSRQWPIARELYIFTNGQAQGAIKQLIDYIVDPLKGQKAVLEVGFIPLEKK
ncbi:MAG: phosphate ABC transporter substrate-binding protein [Desulfovibrionaceae bacterium]